MQQIEALPGDTVTTTQLRQIKLIRTDQTAQWFVTKWGLTPGHRIRNGNGEIFVLDKRELLAALTGSPRPLARNPAVPQPSADSSGVAALFERFQRDFAATIDALHDDYREEREKHTAQLRVIFNEVEKCLEETRKLRALWER